MQSRPLLLSLLLVALLLLLLTRLPTSVLSMVPQLPPETSPSAVAPPPLSKRYLPLMVRMATESTPTPYVVGYFTEWGVYDRNYHVKTIATSGSAATLTHINYAFSNISSGLECQLGDPYADYERAYNAEESVDGVADGNGAGEVRGNFNQLRKLKLQYPHLKVLISVGGWSWSDKFSDAALTTESRRHFVESCITLFLRGEFADGVTAPGIFDGIDIDWEYPAACGNTCNFRPEDSQNFTLLLEEFRTRLDALESETGRTYLLTIAAPATADKIEKMEGELIHPYLDFINIMAYDFHGSWSTTAHAHSALYGDPADPQFAQGLWAAQTVQLWMEAGVPAEKLLLGVPFYGHGWRGVAPANNGLYQPTGGAAPGTYEAGSEDYEVLKALESTYGSFREANSGAFWIYNPDGGIFWSYDDPLVLGEKMRYIRDNGLGGVMFWELSGDDPTGTLIQAIREGLNP